MNSEQTSKNIFMDTTEVRCYIYVVCAEAVVQRCSVKKVFLEILQNSQENTCARASLLIKLIKKETLAQVFSREFCEIFKNVFF